MKAISLSTLMVVVLESCLADATPPPLNVRRTELTESAADGLADEQEAIMIRSQARFPPISTPVNDVDATDDVSHPNIHDISARNTQLLAPVAQIDQATAAVAGDGAVLINHPMRIPSCTRKPGKLHTQRHWSISYDWDNYYNGMHCGLSVRQAMRDFKLCRPLTDWTCVASGDEGRGGVTIDFHTPRTCDDKRVHEAIKKATGGNVFVFCKHV